MPDVEIDKMGEMDIGGGSGLSKSCIVGGIS
jgi:hypothetical protein